MKVKVKGLGGNLTFPDNATPHDIRSHIEGMFAKKEAKVGLEEVIKAIEGIELPNNAEVIKAIKAIKIPKMPEQKEIVIPKAPEVNFQPVINLLTELLNKPRPDYEFTVHRDIDEKITHIEAQVIGNG